MLPHQIVQWSGQPFFANLPEHLFYQCRETGYTADLVKVLAKSYPEIFEHYDVLLHFQLVADAPTWELSGFSRPLILFITGHESPKLPPEVINGAAIIFKQYAGAELLAAQPHIFRIPIGPSCFFPDVPVVPFGQRSHSVFFAGNLHRGRGKLYGRLSGLMLPFGLLHRLRSVLGTDFGKRIPGATITFSSQFHSGYTPLDYARFLANSKIVLCPYGVDETETMRHFEAAKQGCVIVTDRMPDTWYFRDAPFVVISGWKGIYKELRALLANAEGLSRKASQTLQWWREVCSPEAVARYTAAHIPEAAGNDGAASLSKVHRPE